MFTKRISLRALAGVVLLAGTAAAQAPRVEDVLARLPNQSGVAVTTPTGADLAGCKAEALQWPGSKARGVKVTDITGRPVRQFIDSTGTGKWNIFSYYLDGVESYREIDSDGSGRPDQYRWLGANGGKWGGDPNKTGTITTWYVMSPEELSQELLAALISQDKKRHDALLPTDADLKKLGVPAADAALLLKRTEGAAAKLQTAAAALKLTPKAKWVHLQLGLPHTTPKDAFNGHDDLVKHKTAAVLIETEDKKAEVFQTGELVLIGRAWKVVDGPTVGAPGTTDENVTNIPKEIEAEVTQLSGIQPPAANTPADATQYHLARAAVLEQIVAKTAGAQQFLWLRQLIEAYAAAAEVDPSNPTAMPKLKAWQTQIAGTAGATDAASFVTFRLLNAEYGAKLSAAAAAMNNDEAAKVQAWWRESLEAFVKTFPKTAEAPDAVQRLALASEFSGPDGEAKAKEWYEKLAKDYPTHSAATKAAGAVKRLSSEGQPFELSGTTLDGKPFTSAQLVGNPTVVVYWASWGRDVADELKRLAELDKAMGGKVQLLTISLDEQAATAAQTIQAAGLAGTHLYAAGGLENSPLAVAYGIQMVPHILVVGKDGKVINRNAQSGPLLKAEIEKLLK